jgi:predicted acyltransferase
VLLVARPWSAESPKPFSLLQRIFLLALMVAIAGRTVELNADGWGWTASLLLVGGYSLGWIAFSVPLNRLERVGVSLGAVGVLLTAIELPVVATFSERSAFLPLPRLLVAPSICLELAGAACLSIAGTRMSNPQWRNPAKPI